MNKKQWKHVFAVMLACLGLSAVFLMSGCWSPTVVEEFDKDGKLVKKTTTEESVIKSVISSTKDKTVFCYRRGWAAYLRLWTVNSTTVSPEFDCFAGKEDEGFLTIHKDQQNLSEVADVVKATTATESLSVSPNGIGSSGLSGSAKSKLSVENAAKD